MIQRFVTLVILFLILGPQLRAQDRLTVERRTGIEVDLPDSVTDEHARLRWLGRNIILFSRRYPQEKVYLHLDNTGYFRGETIFFKAYVVQDGGHRPTTLSSVLYVELLLPTGEVIKTSKLPIKDGQADGCFKLDDLIISGFYEVRAYTRYMTNWGSDAVFSRVVPIFNKPREAGHYAHPVIDERSYRKRLPNYREEADDSVASATVKKLTVRFFPEGGHLVEGLRQWVAFEVLDGEGRGLDVTGLLQEDDSTLCTVSTLREGRGVMTCTPRSGHRLSLVLSDDKGRPRRFALPDAEENGVSLHLEEMDSLLPPRIILTARGSYAGHPLALLMQHRGSLKNFMIVELGEQADTISLADDELQAGISRLAVISAQGEVLAERLFFTYPTDDFPDTVRVSSEKPYLLPYEKVQLHIDAPSETTFSVAVRDADTEVNGTYNNSWTWLLLTSELKGYVSHPEYYLQANDDEHRRATDLLMMVQGWRRYDLRQMMKGDDKGLNQPAEKGLFVFGNLNATKKKNTVDKVDFRLTLFNNAGMSMHGKRKTEDDGYFIFHIPDCEGEWTMFIDTKKDGRNADYRVSIDRHFSPAAKELSPFATEMQDPLQPNVGLRSLSAEELTEIAVDSRKGSMTERTFQLPNVTVKKRRDHRRNARAAWERESRGAYWSSIYYDVDKEADRLYDSGEEVPDFLSWLTTRNPFFKGDGEVFTTDDSAVGDELILTYKGRPIIWFLSNVFYNISGLSRFKGAFEPNQTTLDPFPFLLEDVKSVYIAEDNAAWRDFGRSDMLQLYNPVSIFVYLHRTFNVKNKGVRKTYFQAYDRPAHYEMPDYSVLPREEDFRRTLFWDPSVKADKQGHATIEFYNNSSCQQLILSVDGIGSDGSPLLCP